MTAQLHLMQTGGPFEVAQVPKRTPGPNELLIRQHATALNGRDLKQRDYGLFISRWPHVLGIEGAGVVEAVGSDVWDFRPGDEIMACMAGQAHGENWGGSYQEHVNVPASFFVAKKPSNISMEEAASLP
jgi:NADPH:quinone reductase-like Zn-dependent oxidoreductase